jgi:hypothetical protein
VLPDRCHHKQLCYQTVGYRTICRLHSRRSNLACSFLYWLHLLYNIGKTQCQELFLVVPDGIEPSQRAYETHVRTERCHYILVDRVRFELTMSGYLMPYVITDLVLYRPNSYHRYFNDPIFWSPELDSNQRSPPSKGGSLTRLAHREMLLAGKVGVEPTIHAFKVRCLTTWLLPNNFGEGTESRTLACGFGDRRATITLYQHILEVDVRIELTTFVPGICNPAPCHPGHRPILFSTAQSRIERVFLSLTI